MWEGRGVDNNALEYQLKELELKICGKANLDFYLDQILETSKKLTWLTSFDKKYINELFLKLPEKYKLKVDEILKIILKVNEI